MMPKVLGNHKTGRLFVMSAPAGTGKSTLVNMLLEEFPDTVVQSCSCTTRNPRPGEVDGTHYHFITLEEFEAKIEAHAFLEHATVFGNYYGTLKPEVEALLQEGKHVVLVIDTQGAMQIKKAGVEATFIFVSAPNMEELKKRLFKRRTEEETIMQTRLQWAQRELEMKQHYDYHIINDHLETAYQVLRSIFIAEEHNTKSEK